MSDIDPALRSLLEDVPRPPDTVFVAQVDERVLLDRAYATRRQRAWGRFATDAASAGALITAMLVFTLWSTGGVAGGQEWGIVGMLAAMTIGWAATNRWATA